MFFSTLLSRSVSRFLVVAYCFCRSLPALLSGLLSRSAARLLEQRRSRRIASFVRSGKRGTSERRLKRLLCDPTTRDREKQDEKDKTSQARQREQRLLFASAPRILVPGFLTESASLPLPRLSLPHPGSDGLLMKVQGRFCCSCGCLRRSRPASSRGPRFQSGKRKRRAAEATSAHRFPVCLLMGLNGITRRRPPL